jgi:hypothetical protein
LTFIRWPSDLDSSRRGRLALDRRRVRPPAVRASSSYPYEQSTWPAIGTSTAGNADTAYGIWRACFEGYETWLNTVDRGSQYGAGEQWGCVGRWFSGRWHTPASDGYVQKVQGYLNSRIWRRRTSRSPERPGRNSADQ